MSDETSEQWWVTWSLEIVRIDTPPNRFQAPDVNVFRIPFPSARAAATFVGEVERFTGGTVVKAIHEGIVVKIKP